MTGRLLGDRMRNVVWVRWWLVLVIACSALLYYGVTTRGPVTNSYDRHVQVEP